jgi:hypothetical protein
MSFGELQLKVEDLWAGFPSLEEPDRRVLRGIDFFYSFRRNPGFHGTLRLREDPDGTYSYGVDEKGRCQGHLR